MQLQRELEWNKTRNSSSNAAGIWKLLKIVSEHKGIMKTDLKKE